MNSDGVWHVRLHRFKTILMQVVAVCEGNGRNPEMTICVIAYSNCVLCQFVSAVTMALAMDNNYKIANNAVLALGIYKCE